MAQLAGDEGILLRHRAAEGDGAGGGRHVLGRGVVLEDHGDAEERASAAVVVHSIVRIQAAGVHAIITMQAAVVREIVRIQAAGVGEGVLVHVHEAVERLIADAAIERLRHV